MFKKFTIYLFISLFFLVVAGVVLADTPVVSDVDTPAGIGKCDASGCSLPNPLGEKNTDPRVIIGKGIGVILGVLGSIALAVFIYGGLLWLTSAGNEQRIKKGKDVLFWAVLGLLVIFSAYTIINFFLGGQFLGIFFI